MRQRDKKNCAPFVTAYLCTMEYGGPEEGGWCWTRREPIAVRYAVRSGKIDEVQSKLTATLSDEHVPRDRSGRFREFSSVLGGVEVRTYIERVYGENAKIVRPRYE